MLNAASKLKGEKDWMKYETARKLHKRVRKIRENYREDWFTVGPLSARPQRTDGVPIASRYRPAVIGLPLPCIGHVSNTTLQKITKSTLRKHW